MLLDIDGKPYDFDKCDFYSPKYSWKEILDLGYLDGDCQVCIYYKKCKESGYINLDKWLFGD